jgi:hypothetical protein
MSRLILSSLAVAALLFTAGAQAGNGNAPGTDSKAFKGEQSLAIGTSHKLLKSYFDTDASGTSLASGFTQIGSTLSLNCPNSSGCTVAGNFNVQIQAAGSSNAVAICMLIDGAYVNCPYNNVIPAGSGYYVNSYQTQANVSAGNHTVDMQVFSSVATTAARWNKEVKMYKP